MARFSVAGLSTVAPTTVRAAASVFAVASRALWIKEIGVFNTTATSAYVALCRFTNATGVGAGLTEVADNEEASAVVGTGFAGHTADGAVGANFRYGALPAAIGGGIIWTFDGKGIRVAPGTANGVGIICPSGTGQIVTYHICWEE